MNTHKHSFVRAVTLLTVLAAVGLIFGCGTDSVVRPTSTAPEATPEVRQSQGFDLGLGAPIRFEEKEVLEWDEVASSEVLPGTTTELNGSRYSLSFFPESLKDPATITIKERDPKVVDVELGPHGAKFSEPVKLVIDYAGTANDPESPNFHGFEPRLFWWNPQDHDWEVVPGTNDKDNRTYTVYLDHFSRYAMRDGTSSQSPAKTIGPGLDEVASDEQQWEGPAGEQQWDSRTDEQQW